MLALAFPVRFIYRFNSQALSHIGDFPDNSVQPKDPSRRAFFRSSGSLVGGAWLTVHLPAVLAVSDLACRAQLERAPFTALSNAEALELEAIAAQIFPTDDSPGAREAGIIYFIDRAMTDLLDEDQAQDIRDGVVEMQSAVAEAYPAMDRFSSLAEQEQIEYLKSIEDTDFFYSIRLLTIAGMFAHPKYGGNRDKIGWRHLGFDDRHVWQPPFGYYDAEYHRGDVDEV